MQKLIIIFGICFCYISFGQNEKCDTKLEILSKVFNDYTVKKYGYEKVFETKVWDKHATISLNNCYVVYFENGKLAIAFNIYLSDDPNQYQYMIEENIQTMADINENSLFKGGDQRLIQLIFYDTKTEKFLGKGKGFPLKGYSWLMEGMGDVATVNNIHDFKKLDVSNNTCILTITECSSCLGGLQYVFKYFDGEILTSEPQDGCFEKVFVKENKMYIKMINNCYEYEYEGMAPVTEDYFLFQW